MGCAFGVKFAQIDETRLKPSTHTGDKVEFNTVEFAETGNKSATKSTVVNMVNFVADTVDFVASVYRALQLF